MAWHGEECVRCVACVCDLWRGMCALCVVRGVLDMPSMNGVQVQYMTAHACTHVGAHMFPYICTRVQTRVCMHVYTHVDTHLDTSVHRHVCCTYSLRRLLCLQPMVYSIMYGL